MACDQGAPPPSPAPAPPVKVVVAPPPVVVADAAIVVENGPRQLSASEGTITIEPLRGSIDHAITASVTVTPASAYQINTDLAPRLALAPPEAIEATPMRIVRWDHDKLALALDVTAHQPGSYAIHGTLTFAVCKPEECFPKILPIELALEVR